MERDMVRSMPQITVLMSVYNGEAYLAEAVESILSQTFSDFIFLILDDASTDATPEILNRYAAKDSRVIIITNERNLGLTASLNRGLAHIDTPYIARMDADDISLPDRFARQWAFMQENPDVAVLGGAIRTVDADGIEISLDFNPPIKDRLEAKDIERGGAIVHPAAFTRTSAITEIGGYREQFSKAQDVDLWLRLFAMGHRLLNLDGEPLLAYRWHESSVTTKNNEMQAVCHVAAVISAEYIRDGLPDPIEAGTVLDISFICGHLLPGQHSAFVWFRLLAWRNIQAKEHYIAQALAFSILTLSAEPEEELVAAWHYFRLQFTEEAERIITKERTRLAQQGNGLSLAIEALEAEQAGFEVLCRSAVHADQFLRRSKKIQHIAFITWGLRLGGAERVACLLAEILQSAGFKVTFFTDELRSQNDYHHTAPRRILSQEPAKRWKQMQAYCRSLQVDLCLFVDHCMQRTLYDLLAAKLAGCLVIPWEHSFFFFPMYYTEHLALIHLRDRVYRAADAIACLSGTHADFWKAAGHRQAVGLPNPLTFDRCLCPRSIGQEKNIIFIGRLCDLKGAKTALRVLADLRVIMPEVRLFFCGRFLSPLYETECHDLARKLNITEHVNFEGYVTDISSYLARSAVHIMPSQCEGSPMSLMEAKAHGVPSVLFEMKYLDLASEEHGCLMVGKNDRQGMVAALVKLLHDREYWRKMSERAYDSLALIDNQEVLLRWQKLFADLEKGRINRNSDDSGYVNDPALLFGLVMREFTCAMSHFRIQHHDIPGYLIKIQYLVDKFLPVHSRRRHYAKVLAKGTWKLLKKLPSS